MARRGRKLGTFRITAGDGANTLLASVDYSLDSGDGWFFASYKDEHFEAASRRDLEKALQVFCRERYSVDYDPYIEVEMPTAFAEETTVVGVKFRPVWVSRAQVTSDGAHAHWLEKRAYFKDADLAQLSQSSDYPKRRDSLEGLLPYTVERYARLRQIQHAIEDVHSRLKAVLADTKAFDALAGGSLLALPAQKKAKR